MDNLVSVIIPVYNGEKVIKKCLKSVCSQEYKNIEIIVVDNGSTDRTNDECKSMQKDDRRILIIDEPHKGVSNARNHGLQVANGEFICFIDADDWVKPDYISKLVEEIGEFDIVCCDFAVEYENEQIKKRKYHRPESEMILLDSKQKLAVIEKSYIFTFTIWSKLYRRSIIGKHRFSNLAYSEDSIFFRELLFSDAKVKYINYSGYRYYINNNSVTVKNKGRGIEITEGALELAYVTWCYSNITRIKSSNIESQLIVCALRYLKANIKRFKFGTNNGRKRISELWYKMKKGLIHFNLTYMFLSIPMRIAFKLDRENL